MIKNLSLFFFGILLTMPPASCKEKAVSTRNKVENPKSQFQWDAEVLNKAVNAGYVRWAADPNVNTEYTKYQVLYSGKALNYISLVAFYDKANQYPEAASRVVEQLKQVISGGKEPCCRGVIAGWANRLIGDAGLSPNKRTTETNVRLLPDRKEYPEAYKAFSSRDSLMPSGLVVPVSIEFGEEQNVNKLRSIMEHLDFK
jgi:hypothetical protein